MNQSVQPPPFPPMTSCRPYMLRAFYAWLSDNDQTPHLIVNATYPGVQVPTHAIKNGHIVLNVAMRAVQHLQLNDEAVSFGARFGGKAMQIYVPMEAIMSIYSRETSVGFDLLPFVALGEGGVPVPVGDVPTVTKAQREVLDRPLRPAPVVSNGPPEPAPTIGSPTHRPWKPSIVKNDAANES